MYKYKAVHIPSGQVWEKDIPRMEGPHMLTSWNDFLVLINNWNRVACLTPDKIPVWHYYAD